MPSLSLDPSLHNCNVWHMDIHAFKATPPLHLLVETVWGPILVCTHTDTCMHTQSSLGPSYFPSSFPSPSPPCHDLTLLKTHGHTHTHTHKRLILQWSSSSQFSVVLRTHLAAASSLEIPRSYSVPGSHPDSLGHPHSKFLLWSCP